MKEMLRNKSRELDDLKRQKELDSSSREQNRYCGETKGLDFIQFTGMEGILNKVFDFSVLTLLQKI